jgi:hypothetical protein
MGGYRRHKHVRGDGLMSRRRFAVRGGVLLALVGTVFLVFAASAAAATVTVTPSNGTATVGQTYCVTATVGGPVGAPPPYLIHFTAAPTTGSTANPVPNTADVLTDLNGQAQFCFTSTSPGGVLITATAGGTGTMSHPKGTATVTFVAASCDQQGENEGNNPGQCGDQDG